MPIDPLPGRGVEQYSTQSDHGPSKYEKHVPIIYFVHDAF